MNILGILYNAPPIWGKSKLAWVGEGKQNTTTNDMTRRTTNPRRVQESRSSARRLSPALLFTLEHVRARNSAILTLDSIQAAASGGSIGLPVSLSPLYTFKWLLTCRPGPASYLIIYGTVPRREKKRVFCFVCCMGQTICSFFRWVPHWGRTGANYEIRETPSRAIYTTTSTTGEKSTDCGSTVRNLNTSTKKGKPKWDI